jgi:hypothetical protein
LQLDIDQLKANGGGFSQNFELGRGASLELPTVNRPPAGRYDRRLGMHVEKMLELRQPSQGIG